jgi:hypothetical protein
VFFRRKSTTSGGTRQNAQGFVDKFSQNRDTKMKEKPGKVTVPVTCG